MIWRPEVVPPVTQEVKGRKQNHFGFWNISSRPTSVACVIEIGQPKFPTSGTLSQTMTLKYVYNSTYHIQFCRSNWLLFRLRAIIQFSSDPTRELNPREMNNLCK